MSNRLEPPRTESAQLTAVAPALDETPTIVEFTEQFTRTWQLLDPPLLPSHDDLEVGAVLLPDLSPDGLDARLEVLRQAEAGLVPYAHLDSVDRGLRDVFADWLYAQRVGLEAGTWSRGLNTLIGPIHAVRGALTDAPRRDTSQLNLLEMRLRAVPACLEGYVETLREGLRCGDIPTRRQVQGLMEMCAHLGAGALAAALGASPGHRYTPQPDAVAAASQAFLRFGEVLREEILPRSSRADAVGRDWLQMAANGYCGADIDLHEAYQWAWHELEAAMRARDAAVRNIVGDGHLSEAIAALNSDPARCVADPQAYVSRLTEEIHSRLDLLAPEFDLPPEARRFEIRLPGPDASFGGYHPMSLDLSEPGYVVWIPPAPPFPWWHDPIYLHHELVPGHHLQFASQRSAEQQPSLFQRSLVFLPGYIEGWATYVEDVCVSMGLLADPGHQLAAADLKFRALLTLAVEIGIHTGWQIPPNVLNWREGETWTVDLAAEALRLHTSSPPEQVPGKVNRLLAVPGQAMCYRLGARLIHQLREEGRARGGFEPRAFHSQFLAMGEMGLDRIAAAMRQEGLDF